MIFLLYALSLLSVCNAIFVDYEQFISEDHVLSYLMETSDILTPFIVDSDNEYSLEHAELENYNLEYVQTIRNQPMGLIEEELEELNDHLEVIYQKLFNFTKILVSLSDEDIIQMSELLVTSENGYYDVIVDDFNNCGEEEKGEEFLAREQKLLKRHEVDLGEYEFDDNEPSLIQFEELNALESQIDSNYYDPDYFLSSTNSSESESKLNEIFESQGILKKVIKKIKKKKRKFTIILKLMKLKKVIRIKKIKICLKIMKTIEKIKRCLILIKKYLIKKIKHFVKNFPWNVVWKFKVFIMLILRILSTILYELKFCLIEISVKLYVYFENLSQETIDKVNFVSKLPTELLYYFEMEIFNRLGWYDDNSKFTDWNNLETSNGDKEIQFEQEVKSSFDTSPSIKDLEAIFTPLFTSQEYNEINEESFFNFDMVFTFDDKDDDDHKLEKRLHEVPHPILQIDTEFIKENSSVNLSQNSSINITIIEKLSKLNITVKDKKLQTILKSDSNQLLMPLMAMFAILVIVWP